MKAKHLNLQLELIPWCYDDDLKASSFHRFFTNKINIFKRFLVRLEIQNFHNSFAQPLKNLIELLNFFCKLDKFIIELENLIYFTPTASFILLENSNSR